jgi:DNA-binding NtrC family response regulator
MNRKKILIVDDEAAIRKMMRVVLGNDIYEFAEAANGLEAQTLLEKEIFDLVISDVIMPDCDGIELVMAVRHKFPDIKIIIMSGGGRIRASHYLDLASKLGATRVFEKPFDTAALRTAVQDMLSLKQ